MTDAVAYTVTGDLLIVGKKNIVCRCPRTLRRLVEADVQYVPVADYYDVVKQPEDKTNTITLFNIRLKDRLFASTPGELPKTFQLVFELPLSFNPFVINGEYGPEVELIGDCIDSYFQELNLLLQCWEPVMKQKLSAENVTFHVPAAWRLKFPWKKITLEDYFAGFNPETDRHKLTVGLGYHNLKEAKMGISLQLMSDPARPPKPSKKRKMESVELEPADPTSFSRSREVIECSEGVIESSEGVV